MLFVRLSQGSDNSCGQAVEACTLHDPESIVDWCVVRLGVVQ
jgi:hypothetical protein